MNKAKISILMIIFMASIAMLMSVSVQFKDTTGTTFALLSTEYPGGAYPLGTTAGARYKVVFYNAGANGLIDALDTDGNPTGDDVLINNGTNPQDVTCAPPGVHGWTQTQGFTVPETGSVNTLIGNSVYCRIFNSSVLLDATKYIVPASPYVILPSPAVQNPSPVTLGGWSAWTPISTAPSTYTISGTISTVTGALAGVSIAATGIDAADIAYNETTGVYSVTVEEGWDGTITPSKADATFVPANRQYTDVAADVIGDNYVLQTVVAPGVPQNLSPNGDILDFPVATAVTLEWDAPATGNVDGYKLVWNNGAPQTLASTVTSWDTPALVAGDYTWKVLAINNTPAKSGNFSPVNTRAKANDRTIVNTPKADGIYAEASFTVTITPVVTHTYQLTINSNRAGTIVVNPTTAAAHGEVTAGSGISYTWTSAALDATTTLVGTYSMTAIAGGTWSAPVTIAEDDFTIPVKGGKALKTKTIAFTWTADPDTYDYTLNVAGPAGTVVTGPAVPLNGTIPYATPALATAAALAGTYTAAAAPAGFHWVQNPIVVDETGYTVAAGKSANTFGSRNNGSKALIHMTKTITFELEADPVYTITLTSNPLGATIKQGETVLGVTSVETPNIVVNPAVAATYTAMLAQYTFVEYVVAGPFTANLNHEFVGTRVYDIDPITPEVINGTTVAITGAGFIGADIVTAGFTPVPNAAFLPTSQGILQLVGTGDVTLSFTPAVTDRWFVYRTGGAWTVLDLTDPETVIPILITVNLGSKDGSFEYKSGTGGNPTLPVELSIFNATLTAQNFVKLSWVSESETNMLGYRVYRSESAEQANAMMITPIMIEATNTSSTANYSLEDREVFAGNTYYYWLEAVDFGHSQFFGPQSVIVTADTTPELPVQSALKNAYPNPFKANSSTTIEVAVKAGENGTVTVYNVLGQVVKTFNVSEGSHNLNWNGRDSKNNICGSGIYFYKLSTPSMNQTKKMVIVK